jgi:nucleotidyltransferase substrate binding protein (TIGR01987 family)
MSKKSSEENFQRALLNLKRSLSTPVLEPRDLSGIIKDFEMAYELSWKVLKKMLATQGHASLGAKDVYSQAYRLGYLQEEAHWLQMISDRNQTAHVYDESDAQRIVDNVRQIYVPLFESLLALLGLTG